MRATLLSFVRLACIPFLFLALALAIFSCGLDWLSKGCGWISDFLTDFVEDVTE